ncbi:MAG: ATP synthase F1 subunit delta [Flaviflexus sp.]|nr:ATP synthase F1 subunit delta [Flaviflexus sp.]
MRRSTTLTLNQALTSWQALLADAEAGRVLDYAREIFGARHIVDEQAALTRALIDPARNGEDRAALAKKVFSSATTSPVVDLVAGLVRGKIASPKDLSEALEYAGTETILISAQQAGRLDKVEEELYRAVMLLSDESRLRAVLGDAGIDADSRIALSHKIFAELTDESRALIDRALEITDNHNLIALLRDLIVRCGERAEHLVGIVTVASPLSRDQEERLTRILEKKYDRPVELHVGVDPAVIGGMHIRVGSDVIDSTLASRINHLKSVFSD